MRVHIDNGKLSISIVDLLDALSIEEKRELAQRIGCERDVIQAVVDQIIEGWTENSSHGPSDQLHECRVRILEAVADVRLKVVHELMSELSIARHNEQRHRDWAYDLYHAWPREAWHRRPDIGAFDPKYPTYSEVRAVAEGAKPEDKP